MDGCLLLYLQNGLTDLEIDYSLEELKSFLLITAEKPRQS